MKKNIITIFKHCLIYAFIIVFSLPLATIAFGTNKAAASEKKVEVKVSHPKQTTVPKEIKKLPPKTKETEVSPKTKTEVIEKKVVLNKTSKKDKIAESNVKTKVETSTIATATASTATSSANATITITPSIGDGASTTRNLGQASLPATPKVTPSPTVEPQVSPTPTPSPTSSEKSETAGGWSKILIALSILIIAAGAALGGYYGYEWLMLRQKDHQDQEPPKSNSRW